MNKRDAMAQEMLLAKLIAETKSRGLVACRYMPFKAKTGSYATKDSPDLAQVCASGAAQLARVALPFGAISGNDGVMSSNYDSPGAYALGQAFYDACKKL